MDARNAVILSAIQTLKGDSTLTTLVRGPIQDDRDPSPVNYPPNIRIDFVPSRNLRGIDQSPIVIGDLVLYVRTNHDQATQASGPAAGTILMSDETAIIARIDKLLLVNTTTLPAQSDTEWSWAFGRTARSDPAKYDAKGKEARAVLAYAIVARGTAI